MAPISVINSIRESYGLILEHWKEITVPLIFLLLLSGAGNLGGSSFSGGGPGRDTGSFQPGGPDSLYTNAMADYAPLLAMGSLLFVIVAVAIVVVIVMAVMNQAVWFYAYEHFHALLTGRKIKESWEQRMKGHAFKALFYLLFNAFIGLAFISAPIAAILLLPGVFHFDFSSGFMGAISSLIPAIALFSAFILALLVVQFFLVPMWVYYAMDRLPLLESAGKSFALVGGNLWLFIKFVGIFFVIGVAAGIGLVMTCCFAYILSPVVQVFLTLLSGVTLMKLKLAIEDSLPRTVKKA